MNDDPNRHPVGPWISLGTVAFLVLYLLSVGPAKWLAYHGLLPDWAFRPWSGPYAPLEWLYEHAPRWMRVELFWYWDLW
jgi:hypothetical protein